jgi:exopolysaccharide biosynthesis polyprenyl glycosylphosphotransferase
VVAIAAVGGYQRKLFGAGTEEYRRVLRAALYFGGVLCIVLYAVNSNMSRAFVFTSAVLALVFNLLVRAQTRRLVRGAWKAGRGTSGVVLVGSGDSVPDMAERLLSAAESGYRVVGALIPAAERLDPQLRHRLSGLNVPVLGTAEDLVSVVRSVNAHAVIVTAPAELGAKSVRRIAWQLEKTEAELMVSTGMEQVAGHRVRVRQAGRAGLLQIDQPMYRGTKRVLKSVSDRVLAGVGLLVLAPLFAVIAAAVRLDSKGPAFFVQTRVGQHNTPFRMLKFRSMYADAEQRRTAIMTAAAATENAPDRGPMAKARLDPRITRIGQIIRRTSLDELPQLINVLTGTMSLVGPRPALPHEVAQYETDAQRRLLVRPGMTGLWQVSGRSDLDWTETVRLDLHYVENWSSTMDLTILARTVKAVTRSTGAY